MAKRKYNKNKNLSPLEELHSRDLEQRMEEERQRHVLRSLQCERLEKTLTEQKIKRILFYPYAVSCLGILVMILYLIIKGHCFVDLPLLMILAVLTVLFLWMQLKENQKLCDRIETMLEERRNR